MVDESIASGGNGRDSDDWFCTMEEETAIIVALHKLSTNPHWKCENGFRNGYLFRFEEMIQESNPGCWLKASPHIESRLKSYEIALRGTLQRLGRSGFVEKCKAYSNMNLLNEIYGKDYDLENIERDENVQVSFDSSDDDGETETIDYAPPSKKVKREKTSEKSGSGKETKSSGGSGLACLQHLIKDLNCYLSAMADVRVRADKREQDREDKCGKVLGELLALDGSTPSEAFEAANILTAQPNKLTIFFSCPSAFKRQYVKTLIGSKCL